MFCPKCGQQNPDGSVFCSGCGASLSNSGSTNQSQSTGGSNNKTNEKIDMAKAVYNDAKNVSQDFLKDPKAYIASFINSDNYNAKLPYAFIIAEVLLSVVYAFVTKISIIGLIKKYLENSPAGNYDYMYEDILKEAGNSVFSSTLKYCLIGVIVVCACRYIMAMLLKEKHTTKKIFAAFTVVSIVEIISYVVNLVYTFLMGIVGYVDYNKFIEATNSVDMYSYDATNSSAKLLMEYGKIVAPIFIVIAVFSIVSLLILVYEVICMVYVTDNLGLSKKKARLASILMCVFTIILIVFNHYFGLMALSKVITGITETTISSLSSLGGGLMSGFGDVSSIFGSLF